MSLATASGAVVGRTVLHSVDGSGVAQPVNGNNPIPTASTSPAASAVLTRADTAAAASGDTGPLAASTIARLAVDISVVSFTGGTAPTITFMIDRQGTDGKWYQLWASAALSAAGPASTSIGDGCDIRQVPTGTVRLRWVFGGTGVATSITFSASIVGR